MLHDLLSAGCLLENANNFDVSYFIPVNAKNTRFELYLAKTDSHVIEVFLTPW